MDDVIVIGAGVVGCMTARELSRWNLKVAVLEAGSDVAEGSSKANSAIVHAGFDAVPGTKKALYNVRGAEMYEALTGELGVPYRRNGALVVAFSEEEIQTVDRNQHRAQEAINRRFGDVLEAENYEEPKKEEQQLRNPMN